MAKKRDEFTAWMHRTKSNKENAVWDKPKITIIKGDITKVKADAIVNAANSGLLGGSGVDWAIRQAAGLGLQQECQLLREEVYPKGLPVGKAVSTGAYKLNAKIIIHTVGPRYYKDNPELLRECYIRSIMLAEENSCESIAFPAISTGAYGFPIEKSAKIVKELFDNFKSEVIQEIILVLWSDEDLRVYKREIEE